MKILSRSLPEPVEALGGWKKIHSSLIKSVVYLCNDVSKLVIGPVEIPERSWVEYVVEKSR